MQYFSSPQNSSTTSSTSTQPKTKFTRSLTTRLKRGLSIRSSTLFDTGKNSRNRVQAPHLKISLPIERPDVPDHMKPHMKEHSSSGWIALSPPPESPISSSSSSSRYQSYTSSPSSHRSSASSRTSYSSETYDGYFPSVNENKVSFAIAPTKPLRLNRESNLSTVSVESEYYPEGELPPAFEEDEEILKRMGVNRFAAADYIQEIEGTPMILVDGKLYL